MNWLNTIVVIFSGMLLFSWPAFYNNFPIVTSDTGAYVLSGFDNFLPEDRPIYYGKFLRHSSLKASLWYSVLAQSLLLVVILFRLVTLSVKIDLRNFFLIIVFIACFTCASTLCSLLLADYATPIMVLSVAWFFIEKNKLFIALSSVVLVYSSICHNSNLITLLLFCFTLALLRFIVPSFGNVLSWLRIAFLFLFFIIATSILTRDVYKDCGKLSPSKGGEVFLISKLLENGLLKQFLNENCSKKTYVHCDEINSMTPNAIAFLWDYQGSALYKNGGNMFNRSKDYKVILNDFFTTPKYLISFVGFSIIDSFRQLFTFTYDYFFSEAKASSPYQAIDVYMNEDLNSFMNSRQFRSGISYQFADLFYILIVFISVVYLVSRFSFSNASILSWIVVFLLLGIVLNAFSAGFFNGGTWGRLTARVIWLIPFCSILHYLATNPVIPSKLED